MVGAGSGRTAAGDCKLASHDDALQADRWSTWARATAGGRSRRTRGRWRASSIRRSSPWPAASPASCTAPGAPTPASMRLHQVAHLDLETRMPPAQLLWRINEELPADINLLALEPTARRFHARHAAVARSYLYQIARRRTALGKPFVWWVKDALDPAAMAAAARQFEGLHDFGSFTDQDPEDGSTKVKVESVEVREEGALHPDPHPRLALPVEDGAAHGGRAGRGRPGRAEAKRTSRASCARRPKRSRLSPPRPPASSSSACSTKAIRVRGRCGRCWRCSTGSPVARSMVFRFANTEIRFLFRSRT